MGPEQADLLIGEGVNPEKIVIGHMCGSTDIAYQLKTLEKGVYIAFDRFGIQGIVGAPMDSVREVVAAAIISAGYADRLMLSHDAVIYMMGRPLAFPPDIAELMSNMHLGHVFEDIIPDLRKMGVTEEQIRTITEENPVRLFSAE